jgi:hypothetical protein
MAQRMLSLAHGAYCNTSCLGKRDAPGEAVVIPAASHNLKVAQWPSDAGFAGPVALAAAAKLASWMKQLLGA